MKLRSAWHGFDLGLEGQVKPCLICFLYTRIGLLYVSVYTSRKKINCYVDFPHRMKFLYFPHVEWRWKLPLKFGVAVFYVESQ